MSISNWFGLFHFLGKWLLNTPCRISIDLYIARPRLTYEGFTTREIPEDNRAIRVTTSIKSTTTLVFDDEVYVSVEDDADIINSYVVKLYMYKNYKEGRLLLRELNTPVFDQIKVKAEMIARSGEIFRSRTVVLTQNSWLKQ